MCYDRTPEDQEQSCFLLVRGQPSARNRDKIVCFNKDVLRVPRYYVLHNPRKNLEIRWALVKLSEKSIIWMSLGFHWQWHEIGSGEYDDYGIILFAKIRAKIRAIITYFTQMISCKRRVVLGRVAALLGHSYRKPNAWRAQNKTSSKSAAVTDNDDYCLMPYHSGPWIHYILCMKTLSYSSVLL